MQHSSRLLATVLTLSGLALAGCTTVISQAVDDEGKASHNPELCVECGMCEQYCPDLAVTVEKTVKAKTGTEGA